jgi:hypothetical protein
MPKRSIVAAATIGDVVVASTRWVTVSSSSPARISVASAKCRSSHGYAVEPMIPPTAPAVIRSP